MFKENEIKSTELTPSDTTFIVLNFRSLSIRTIQLGGTLLLWTVLKG